MDGHRLTFQSKHGRSMKKKRRQTKQATDRPTDRPTDHPFASDSATKEAYHHQHHRWLCTLVYISEPLSVLFASVRLLACLLAKIPRHRDRLTPARRRRRQQREGNGRKGSSSSSSSRVTDWPPSRIRVLGNDFALLPSGATTVDRMTP